MLVERRLSTPLFYCALDAVLVHILIVTVLLIAPYALLDFMQNFPIILAVTCVLLGHINMDLEEHSAPLVTGGRLLINQTLQYVVCVNMEPFSQPRGRRIVNHVPLAHIRRGLVIMHVLCVVLEHI